MSMPLAGVELGPDDARADDLHAYAGVAQLVSEQANEREEERLSGRIDGTLRELRVVHGRAEDKLRRHTHERAPTPFHHAR